jgi:hypothetical protein
VNNLSVDDDIQSFLVQHRTRATVKADFKYVSFDQNEDSSEAERVQPQVIQVESATEQTPIRIESTPAVPQLVEEPKPEEPTMVEEDVESENDPGGDHSQLEPPSPLLLNPTFQTTELTPSKLPEVSSNGLPQGDDDETSVDVPS